MGGVFGGAGFLCLAVLWFATAARALYAIAVERQIHTHELWMYRNYALTFSAVTIRTQLGICMAVWGPNLMSTWYWINFALFRYLVSEAEFVSGTLCWPGYVGCRI
jgi:hypothetical protein